MGGLNFEGDRYDTMAAQVVFEIEDGPDMPWLPDHVRGNMQDAIARRLRNVARGDDSLQYRPHVRDEC